MVKVLPHDSYIKKYINFRKSPIFNKYVITLFLLLSLPIIILLLQRQHDIRQRAAGTPTARILSNPSTLSVSPGENFDVSIVIDSGNGGLAFNSAEATVTVSNLTINSLDIASQSANGCDFVFVNQQKTPTISDPSFSGGIINTSTFNCTLYTMSLTAPQSGSGTVTITNGSVRSFSDHTEIFESSVDGTYTVVQATPTPTPYDAPSFDTALPPATYNPNISLSGTRSASIVDILVNDSPLNISYPTSTSWLFPAHLVIGPNTFVVYGKDAQGNVSIQNSIQITLHRTADINGDGLVNLTDLSIFGNDYQKTQDLVSPLSDIDENGTIDLGDFSVIIKVYEQ